MMDAVASDSKSCQTNRSVPRNTYHAFLLLDPDRNPTTAAIVSRIEFLPGY